MKVQVRKAYTITWDGDNPTYIRAADDLFRRITGHGLDSLDLGDATGAVIHWANQPSADLGSEHDNCFFTFEGHMLGVSWEYELFEYPERGTGDAVLDPPEWACCAMCGRPNHIEKLTDEMLCASCA